MNLHTLIVTFSTFINAVMTPIGIVVLTIED